MDEEHPRPVFGEAIQKAMARKGCDLTLEESRHLARTLLDLISGGVLVADSSTRSDAEVLGNPGRPREVGPEG